jgi:hypothetical protein
MIWALSMPCRYTDVMPRFAWPSCRWMTLSGTPFASHLDGMGVPQLVRREATTHASVGSQMAKGVAGGGAGPRSSSSRAGEDAQQRADRQLDAELEPRRDLLPAPRVHADFSTLAAVAMADQDGAARAVQVTLGEGERLADAKPGSPQQDDQRPCAQAVHPVPRPAHDGDDLLDRRRGGGGGGSIPGRRDSADPCCEALGRSGSRAAWRESDAGRRRRATRERSSTQRSPPPPGAHGIRRARCQADAVARRPREGGRCA